jgi:hypothetical protein
MMFLFLLFFFNYESLDACEKSQLYGEIEKKERRGNEIIKHTKFIDVPKVMNHDSSDFGRLMIKDLYLNNVLIKYSPDNKKSLKQLAFKIDESIILDFNLKIFEQKIELLRPGVLTFIFKKNKKILCTKIIRFVGASG